MKQRIVRLATIASLSLLAITGQLPAWAAPRSVTEFDFRNEPLWGVPGFEPYAATQQLQSLNGTVGNVVIAQFVRSASGIRTDVNQAMPGDWIITSLWVSRNEGCSLDLLVQHLPVNRTTRKSSLVPARVTISPGIEIAKVGAEASFETLYEVPGQGVITMPGKYLSARRAFELNNQQIQRLRQSPAENMVMRVFLRNGQALDVPINSTIRNQWSSVYSYNPTCRPIARRTSLPQRPSPQRPSPQSPISSGALPQLNDVREDHWARPYIEALHFADIVRGRDDGKFLPDTPITRSQFAAIVVKAFDPKPIGDVQFTGYYDLLGSRKPPEAELQVIRAVIRGGFMTGYLPDKLFRPKQNITKAEVITALVSGLQTQYPGKFPSADPALLGQYYQDAAAIKIQAQREAIATATQYRMVVNYPSLKKLEPNRAATRAEVVALVYQALVAVEKAKEIGSPYLVEPVVNP